MKVTDFVKTGQTVMFSHYRAGFLYYEVEKSGENVGDIEVYLFPVEASDLQQATVEREMKAIVMMRYIRKAIEDKTIQLVRKFNLKDL